MWFYKDLIKRLIRTRVSTKDPYGHIFVYTCAYKFNKYIPENIRLLEYVFVSYLQGIGFIETISGHSVMVNVKDFDTHAHTHTNTHIHTNTHTHTDTHTHTNIQKFECHDYSA